MEAGVHRACTHTKCTGPSLARSMSLRGPWSTSTEPRDGLLPSPARVISQGEWKPRPHLSTCRLSLHHGRCADIQSPVLR